MKLAILVLLVLLTGCSASVRQWASAQGGTVQGAELLRAQALTAQFLPAQRDLSVQVAVLAREDLSAFSWPDGHVFLSRGLVASLDDPELAAAIAHELGHLLKDPHGHVVTGLRGTDDALRVEARADRIGVDLLRARGIPREAMEHMLLQVLQRDNLPPETQHALRRRVQLLRSGH